MDLVTTGWWRRVGWGELSWQMFPGGSGGGLEPEGWAVGERECPLGLERRHGQTAGSFHYFGAFEGRFT